MKTRIQPRYTEVLINLMENETTNELLNKALSTYPMYEKTSSNEYIPNFIPTRSELNQKLLNHYKYREIGFETPGRFFDELEITMNEIMPYYNQLMFSMDQDYDIKFNVDYTRNIERAREDEAKATSETETNATDNVTDTSTVQNYNKHVNSKTPQDSLNITNQNIDNVSYADEVSWNHDTNTDNNTHNGITNSTGVGEQNTESNENETTFERVKGNYGQVSVQSLIEHYRELIINIEQKIITDKRIQDLFMSIY